ncbi:CopD family protein [Actinosynnema sp. NPDC047251]|uniref:Copper resistance D domain protein n=1 Tax=Saccharothrix espanaensis (strain ATCC 51144 / DSM 44229 / JCM 9112 / NBRC 15066 / NRRL 15764) TaxID=1179773 RepID=K0JNL2_SACES|nr:CopD family protein [Saccharothrix espanaensis]CCH27380.1 Copper resistance D domain protein [Saccharothrix espanaensis DSM 44229]
MTTNRTTTPANRYWVLGGLLGGGAVGAFLGLGLSTTPVAVGVAEPGVVVQFAQPLVRTLLDLAATVVVGLSLLPKLLGFSRPTLTEPVMRVARPAAVVGAAVWVFTALLSIVVRAYETRPDVPVTMGSVVDYVQRVGAGQGLLFSAVCALIYLWIGVLAVRKGESVPAELRILVSMFGLLPLPVTGHASNWKYHDYSMISMELHVLGAAAWTGGLAALIALVAHRRGLLAEALPKFSKLATVSLAVVSVTGLFNGLLELALNPVITLPGSLFTTSYGLILVGKIVCAAVLAVLGANIRWRMLPNIAQHKTTAIVGWAAFELAVMGVAFGLAVVLSRAPVA